MNSNMDIKKMVDDAREEMKSTTPLLTMEPVEPKGGSLIKEKPFDPQPVLERISILTASYEMLEADINATDTSRVSMAEAAAYNELKKAYQAAIDAGLQLLG